MKMAKLDPRDEKEIDRLLAIAVGASPAVVRQCLQDAMVHAVRTIAATCKTHGAVGQVVGMRIEAQLNEFLRTE